MGSPGNISLFLQIGPFEIEILGNRDLIEPLQTWFDDFRTHEKRRIHGRFFLEPRQGPFLPPDSELDFTWRRSGPGRHWMLTFPYVRGSLLDPDGHTVRLEIDPYGLAMPVPSVLLWMNQWLFWQTHRKGGGVLHGAGLIYNERAILAVGPSGAGKTTLSRIAERAGWGVLDDEVVLFIPERRRYGRCMVFRAFPRNPVEGRINGLYPVELVALIGHGEVVEVEAVRPRDRWFELLSQWFIIHTEDGVIDDLIDRVALNFENTRIVRIRYPLGSEILEYFTREIGNSS